MTSGLFNCNSIDINMSSIPKDEIIKLEWENVLNVTFKDNFEVYLNHFTIDVINTWESEVNLVNNRFNK